MSAIASTFTSHQSIAQRQTSIYMNNEWVQDDKHLMFINSSIFSRCHATTDAIAKTLSEWYLSVYRIDYIIRVLFGYFSILCSTLTKINILTDKICALQTSQKIRLNERKSFFSQ